MKHNKRISKMSSFDVVIVANGTFPTHPVPLALLQEAQHIVACDGAIAHLSAHPTPHLAIIGDGDSVPAEYRHLLIKVDEQEDNDLTKATRYCIDRCRRFAARPLVACYRRDARIPDSSPRIAYLGCTGGREDHTLGNISLLMRYYREMGVEGRMFTDEGIFTPAHGDRTFSSFSGQQVSIFNFGCTRLVSKGLKWDSYAYQEWWQGTLNEAVGNSFTLSADGYYLVFQTYGQKSLHRVFRC